MTNNEHTLISFGKNRKPNQPEHFCVLSLKGPYPPRFPMVPFIGAVRCIVEQSPRVFLSLFGRGSLQSSAIASVGLLSS